MNEADASGKIITFYSYKGGTGRSMALANAAWILASQGKRVLAVDWDLEAPGLHRYFYPFLADKDLTSSDGVIDFVTDFAKHAMTPPKDNQKPPDDWYVEYANILQYATSLEWEFPTDNRQSGRLDFIPAGRQGPSYATRVNQFNWQSFYDGLGGGAFLEAAKKRMRAEYDYILIDSRTGVSDTSGVCTVQMPDILVICFTLNYQSIEGAAAVASSVWEQRKDSQIVILPVPMRAENNEKEKLEARREYAKKTFARFPRYKVGEADSAYWASIDKDEYWKRVEVLYVPYYAYEELLAPFGDKPDQPHTVLASAENLTSYLSSAEVQHLNPPSASLRKEVLAKYARMPLVLSDAATLSKSAENLVRNMGERERAVARQVLTRLVRLAGPGEVGESTRIKVKLGDTGESSKLVVDDLANAGVLAKVQDGSKGEEAIELADDSLLQNWDRLKEWIREDRDFLLWRQQLQSAAAEWERSHYDQWALLRGVRLEEAKRWQAEHQRSLNESEQKYIQASTQRVDRLGRRRRYQIATAVLVIAVLILLGLTLRWRIRKERADNILKAVNESNEPIVKALLLTELSGLPEPAGGMAVARSLANLPLPILVLRGHDSTVFNIAFSPDGKLIVTASYDGTARVWDATTGENTAILERHESAVYGAKFSNDSRYIVTASEESSAQVWEAKQGDVKAWERKATLRGYNSALFGLAFSPDGQFVATVRDDGTVWIYEVSTEIIRAQLNDQTSNLVTSVAFSSDGKSILTAQLDGEVKTWDLDKIKEEQFASVPKSEIKLEATTPIQFLITLSSDGKYVVTIVNGIARVWESGTGRKVAQLGVDSNPVVGAAFSLDGIFIVTIDPNGIAEVWKTETGTSVNRLPIYKDLDGLVVSRYGLPIYKNGDGLVEAIAMALSPDGKFIAKTRTLPQGNSGQHQEAPVLPDLPAFPIFPAANVVVEVSRANAHDPPSPDLGWEGLLKYLRDSTNACLTVEQRVKLVGETVQEANKAYESCRNQYRIKP